jgi:hypothetical protein
MNIPKSAMNPAVSIPLIDTRRTAAGFDPTKAQPLPKQVLENPRMSEAASQAIKSALHGNGTTELDHIIALGLSGSNDMSNLQIQPGIKNGPAAVSDKLENSLIEQVKQGKISLIDAQNQLAKEKGTSLPELGQRSPVDQWLMDHPSILKPMAGIQDFITGLGQDVTSAIQNPKESIPGAGMAIENFGLGVAKTISNAVLSNPLLNPLGLSKTNPKLQETQQKVNDWFTQNQGELSQVVQSNLPPGVSAQRAYSTGNFVGSFIPYMLMGSLAEEVMMEAGTAALGASDWAASNLSLRAVSNIGKVVSKVAGALGFISVGQIEHNPQDGTRAEQLKNDLLMYGLFELGLGGIKIAGEGIGKVLDIIDKMKSGEKVPIGEVQDATTQAAKEVETQTGKTPPQVLADTIKNKTIDLPKTESPTQAPKETPAETPKQSPMINNLTGKAKGAETGQGIKPLPTELEPLAREARKIMTPEQIAKRQEFGSVKEFNDWLIKNKENVIVYPESRIKEIADIDEIRV